MRMINKIENKTIKLKDGRLLGFADYGDPNGLPIFFFHGFPGSRLEARRFHNFAASNGYRVIGIDRPGFGLSSIDKNRSILSWATDVTNFADCLGIKKFSVIGHSGGGPFVAACAYVIPERLNGAAIVSGMAPFEKPESHIGISLGQRIANQLLKAIPWLTTVMMYLTSQLFKHPKMINQMLKQLPEVDKKIFSDPEQAKYLVNCSNEAFRNGVTGPAQEMKILLLRKWGFDLENVRYPISIWQGTLDTQAPMSHAQVYAKYLPICLLNVVENEGHHSLITNQMDKIFSGLRDPKQAGKRKAYQEQSTTHELSHPSLSSRLFTFLNEGKKKIMSTLFSENPKSQPVINSKRRYSKLNQDDKTAVSHPMKTRNRNTF